MDTTLTKSTEGINWIPVRWAATTAPETPFTLPAFVKLNVTPDAIQVRSELTSGPSDEEKPDVHFYKSEIIEVEIMLILTAITATI